MSARGLFDLRYIPTGNVCMQNNTVDKLVTITVEHVEATDCNPTCKKVITFFSKVMTFLSSKTNEEVDLLGNSILVYPCYCLLVIPS